MERYAAGRFPEALLAFQEALQRDPESRAARVAAERVRAEIAMAGAMKPNSEPCSGEAAAPDAGTLLDRIAEFIDFEDTIGDQRELVGRAEAMRGRISQLLAEKKFARASHRRFTKDRELHALSRRLA